VSAALRAQDRQRRTDDLQRAEKVGVEIAGDLFVAELLEDAHQAVARVVTSPGLA
jgi:hypothetical protein